MDIDTSQEMMSPPQSPASTATDGTADTQMAYKAEDEIKSSPTVLDGVAYFGDQRGVIHALRTADQKPLWTFAAEGEVIASVSLAGGRVIVGAYDNNLYCLDRKDGSTRTIETTFVWDGADKIILSGYPGKRDWVASMARNSEVKVHSVEFQPFFDIPAQARVVRDLNEKLPRVFAFIEHWALRPGFPRTRFKLLLGTVKINRALRLPWWGPFMIAKRVFNGMPCVEITFAGEPVIRQSDGPPALSEPHDDRPF